MYKNSRNLKIGLLVLLLSLVGTVAQALNLAAIRQEVRYKTQDNPLLAGTTYVADTDRQRRRDDILTAKINIAQDNIVRKTKCLKLTAYIDTTTNISSYTFPSASWQIDRIGYWQSTGVYPVINAMSLGGLDSENPRWEQLGAGLPKEYYIYGNVINLVPKPSSAYAGSERIRIDYLLKCSSLTAETDTPYNGYTQLYPYHELIIYYVAMSCKEDEMLYDEARYYEDKYTRLLGLMIKEITERPDWRPDFSYQMK